MSAGSFPGTEPAEPVRIMSGENPDLPSIPELPNRGPGADMTGRALALLAGVASEFVGETTTTGWRLAGRSTDAASRVMRRADSWLAHDLEAAEAGYQGASAVKVAVAGPWTVAATVELRNGHRMLYDPGALRDLATAYPVMVARLVRRLSQVWPQVMLQIDEPVLPAVLAARVPTPSALDFYRAVPADAVRAALSTAVEAAGCPVVLHCCAVPAPLDLLCSIGADWLSLDLTAQRNDGRAGHDEAALGAALEAGTGLVAGVVPWTTTGPAESAGASVLRVTDLLHRLGIQLDHVAGRLALSTPCGLAGASPDGARRITVRAAEAVSILRREVA